MLERGMCGQLGTGPKPLVQSTREPAFLSFFISLNSNFWVYRYFALNKATYNAYPLPLRSYAMSEVTSVRFRLKEGNFDKACIVCFWLWILQSCQWIQHSLNSSSVVHRALEHMHGKRVFSGVNITSVVDVSANQGNQAIVMISREGTLPTLSLYLSVPAQLVSERVRGVSTNEKSSANPSVSHQS